jgi:Coenzyme PQQ synthesis protein D (PqqD)
MTSYHSLSLDAASQLSRSLKANFRNFKGKLLVAVGPDSYEFSSSGAFILAKVEDTKTLGEIAFLLAESYAVEPDTALADVIEFATDLVGLGILECR